MKYFKAPLHNKILDLRVTFEYFLNNKEFSRWRFVLNLQNISQILFFSSSPCLCLPEFDLRRFLSLKKIACNFDNNYDTILFLFSHNFFSWGFQNSHTVSKNFDLEIWKLLNFFRKVVFSAWTKQKKIGIDWKQNPVCEKRWIVNENCWDEWMTSIWDKSLFFYFVISVLFTSVDLVFQ